MATVILGPWLPSMRNVLSILDDINNKSQCKYTKTWVAEIPNTYVQYSSMNREPNLPFGPGL
jgi:hypothetical protein